MYSDVQSNITHNSQTVENLHSSENKQISTQLILLTLYCVKEEGPKLYTKVCPEGIQPCDMKNRDIHWRRYKKHCTQDNYTVVPFKVGTLGPHIVLPITIICPVVFSWISSMVWNLFPFKGDFSFGKSRSHRAPNMGCREHICSLNGIYCPTDHWLVQWSHPCSHMCIPVHSPWLPGYINVAHCINNGWTFSVQTSYTACFHLFK